MRSKGYRYLEDRFGIEEGDLESLELVERHDDLWLASEEETGYDAETRGIRALRDTGIGLKPTTYLLQQLDEKIEKNIVDLTDEEFKDLLARENMIDRELSEGGYVALKYGSRIVGCGFYKNEKVSSRIPKGRSKELLKALF
ncbi:hypothetical protein GKQ38_01130 [Candidatus Nanohaloarchaea archaeon]|nr:hypothetical protein GKQ38_01130 [Candidatus Nanohaloarchaea archaeon]